MNGRHAHLPLGADVNASQNFLRRHIKVRPKIAVILGSGLEITDSLITRRREFEAGDIPGYPRASVEGHSGNVMAGIIRDVPAVIFKGRFHFYEGYSRDGVSFQVRLSKGLGIGTIVFTNAAGGLNPLFRREDLMLIIDQLDCTYGHPPHSQHHTDRYFPTLPRPVAIYDRALVQLMRTTASENAIDLREGVYCGVLGPSYETPAEQTMLSASGGDAVGMSTVYEARLARLFGMRVAGISCITNRLRTPKNLRLSHAEVTRSARVASVRLSTLLEEFIGACRVSNIL